MMSLSNNTGNRITISKVGKSIPNGKWNFLQHKSFRFRHIFFAILIVIFLFDQRHLHNLPPPEEKFPYKIFESIKKHTSHVSVLEIPFTVRDGFTYFGDGNAVTSITI